MIQFGMLYFLNPEIIIQLQTMSKIRKVYNLRKTANVKPPPVQEESRVSQFREQQQPFGKATDNLDKNVSSLSVNVKENPNKNYQQTQPQYLVEGEQLIIDTLQLNFDVPINDIDKKNVKIKNIGSSAIYIEFNFKNNQKINNSGFKDTKIKFYCHYHKTVIKPGQQTTFIFSFLSDFPGTFTEQIEINCQPSLKTKIPNLKLNGRAYIADEWLKSRAQFNQILEQVILKAEVSEILNDAVNQVKLPPPPRPDVSNPKVAQIQFQKKNKDFNLFFNEYLHNWFKELYDQICDKGNIPAEQRYWDQSTTTLKTMIDSASYLDQVDKKCFNDRLEHYCYLSMTPPANKSQLYSTVYQFFSTTAYTLGGEYVDSVRKQLDMWQIPFREPLESDTPEDLKLRKQEVDKIKAEWVKKAKKKKWGEEQEKEMINQFKKRVQIKANENLLNKFTNFEEGAQFVKTRQFLKKSDFTLADYSKYLQRIKTVKQYPLDGKKVMIKWHLKLKDNIDDHLKELQQYLTKKKEQQKRLEEQKKQGVKKKKAPAKPKKKGQKEEEEQKPLHFDFMNILDQQNWNGFIQTFKLVMEKQPFLILIGITYGPRSGRQIPEYSVHFILEHLKTLQNSIQFFPHDQLLSLQQKIQSQTISQGSILLLQNLNFLPWEVAQQQVVQHSAQQGHPPKILKRKLLQPEIREFFDNIGQSIDILVNQDRYLQGISGFSAYLNKEVVMGTQWWRYVGLSMKVIDSTIVFGQDFTPQNLLLLSRLVKVTKQIYLTGLSGVKFYLSKNNLNQLGGIQINPSQKLQITNFLAELGNQNISHKIIIPSDFVLRKQAEGGDTLNFNGSEGNIQGYEVIDIGSNSIANINKINIGSLFILGQTSIQRSPYAVSSSLTQILKSVYLKQQQKRERHSHQVSNPSGINYNQDLVVYLIGISESFVDKIELKEKKVKISEQQGQQQAEQEQQGQSDKKKIQLISDFRLSSLPCLYRLWRGKFDMGLKDISKYGIISDD